MPEPAMLVASAWMALGVLIPVAPNPVAPIAVVDATPPEDPHAWWGLRAADRLAQNLDDLGVDVAEPRSLPRARPGFDALQAHAHVRGEDAPTVTWIVRDGPRGYSWRGPLDALEVAAAEAAVAVARGRGLQPSSTAEAALERDLPLPLQRLLGRARRRSLDGHALQASLMYERASTLGGRFWYEAAREAVLARSEATKGAADAELAKAAAVRASVAARAGDPAAEAAAWMAFSKYTPHRLRPWSTAWRLGREPRAFSTRDGLWIDDGGAHVRIDLPAPGVPAPTASARHRIVAAGPDFLVTSDGQTLRRVEAGVVRWALRAPVTSSRGARVASGFLAVWGDDGGAWVDAGLGRVRERFEGEVIAEGDRGLVLRRGGGVAFLRAGQSAPAWTRDLGLDGASPRKVLSTEERVIVEHGDQLHVLRARNGQPVGAPVPLGGRRLLHAEGRYAVVADTDHHQVIDILALEVGPPHAGPGQAVAAATRAHGVAVGFERGDVLLLSPSGALQGRVMLPRAPTALVARDDFRVVIAIEPMGVHAIGDIREDEATDVDALVSLARLSEEQGRTADALRLVEWAARLRAGSIRAAEVYRAALLPEGPARQWALARAEAAGDPSRSLADLRALWPVDAARDP